MDIPALDLKSGGAVHVRTPESDWLFDTGSQHDYERVVRQYLRSKGVDRLDGLVLIHRDAGHLAGIGRALFDFRPRQLLDTASTDRALIHRRLITEPARHEIPRRLCAAGDEFDLSRDIKARILFPPREFEGGKADDQALIIQLAVSGKSLVLFMSNSGPATEDYLVRNYPDLRSDIVIKGQHYSGVSGSDSFLNAVQPAAIIATSRDFPESERIKSEWAEGVGARGIKLLRQDETGAVRITVFPDRWEARTYVTSEVFRRMSR
jgi:competence protein ComEC